MLIRLLGWRSSGLTLRPLLPFGFHRREADVSQGAEKAVVSWCVHHELAHTLLGHRRQWRRIHRWTFGILTKDVVVQSPDPYVVVTEPDAYVVTDSEGRSIMHCRDAHSAEHYRAILTQAFQRGYRQGYRTAKQLAE